MRPIVSAFIFIIAAAGAARAQDAVPPATNFPKGTFDLTLEADYAHSFQLSRARVEAVSIGAGYYLFDNFAVNVEAAGYAIDQSGPDSLVSDLDLRIRHHLINAGRLSLFADVSGGVSYATARTPATGTYFNLTLQPGVGATWRLHDKLFLIGGVRYWHISNARIEGPERNPSINAINGYIGLMATF
ncbi:MAG TPA: acyloxyacyl hydrolase [Tepidisphaeraceae bacterium]|nr:acyloxyacyl hydrolase [Tepidisphaeraceae bacterium]